MDRINLKKHIGLKIKQLRIGKQWSRQQVAEKLNISLTAYANIERGETDICITRLEEISELFNIGLSDLLGTEKATYNFTGTHNYCHNVQVNSSHSAELKEFLLKKELEKCQLEINFLKEENFRLKEILSWLKEK